MQRLFHSMMSKLVYIYCVLYSLHFILYECQGRLGEIQIHPPSNKSLIVVLPGQNAILNWTITSNTSWDFLAWSFRRRGDSKTRKGKRIARYNRIRGARIPNSSLPGVAIEDPPTLVLKNVNERYNGEYRFHVRTSEGNVSISSVQFFVAVTPILTVNCSGSTYVIQGDYFACKCKGTDGNPPADVAWYKNNTTIVTGKEKAILVLSNVDKDDSGTYRCVAKSGIEEAKIETEIELIVNYPPESGQSATIPYAAEAQPGTSFEIVLRCTLSLIKSSKTYTIVEANGSNFDTRVAEDVLEQRYLHAAPIYLSLNGPSTSPTKLFSLKRSQSTRNGNTIGPSTSPTKLFQLKRSQTTRNGDTIGPSTSPTKLFQLKRSQTTRNGNTTGPSTSPTKLFQLKTSQTTRNGNTIGPSTSPTKLFPLKTSQTTRNGPSTLPKKLFAPKTNQTTTNGNATDKTCLDTTTSGSDNIVVWNYRWSTIFLYCSVFSSTLV